MGKAIWEFISIVYDSHWDFLYVNDNNITFKSKVKSKFSSQVKNIQPPVNKGKEVAKPSFVSVILFLIPAKLNKEVKEISKFFKKIEKPAANKLYAQACCLNQSPMHHLLTLL